MCGDPVVLPEVRQFVGGEPRDVRDFAVDAQEATRVVGDDGPRRVGVEPVAERRRTRRKRPVVAGERRDDERVEARDVAPPRLDVREQGLGVPQDGLADRRGLSFVQNSRSDII
ncbi:hypothetical protein [Halomicrococcus gelatinilyticus]|uniref:hypothetical protein n=1 Tax=Halomicrococcus gelatinilyticus TaxID=1702103 RepID=UPI002E101420